MTERRGRLQGEVAIVTGSSGLGSGTEIARLFAAEGAKVVVTGRNEQRGREVASRLVRDGAQATFVRADLTEEAECRRLVEQSIQQFGALTILVNNAVSRSTADDAPVASVTPEVWEQTMAVNLTAVVFLCRYAIPRMIEAGRGSIVNVGSRTGIRGTPNLSAYSASKGALHALTRSIAIDYAKQGIRCNTVSPGYIVGKERDRELSPERRAWVEAMHLTDPPTTTDVAYAALYFASRESGAVTGVTLPVDGGGSMARGIQLG